MTKKLLLVIMLLAIQNAYAQHVSVLTQHNNNTRAGLNNRETGLNTTNVNMRQFGKLFSVAVDDQTYAQPLIVADVSASGQKANVLYVATVNNSVYAFNADNGTPYWHKNYTPAGMRPPKNTDMTGACGGGYRDFSGNMGIVGTPVIDSAAKVMYFVARSLGSGKYYQHLHAVSILTGNEMPGSPVAITATYAGTGTGSVNGIITFELQKQNQRQALTLANGLVYITFSSHCDWGPYHGWILAYDTKTLQQKTVYNNTPDGLDGGFWQSGGGPSIDSDGNIIIVTGNGTVGTPANRSDPRNRGESALKLTHSGSTLAVSSFFTPKNFQALENADLDYGSVGSFLIPNSPMYLTGCKDGNMYFLNKDNMGGYSATANNVQQTINLGANRGLHCQPSYYKGGSKEFVYVWSENDALRAYPFNRTTNMLDVNNQVVSPVKGPSGASGAYLSVSSNGNADGSGIVWASYAANGNANQSVRPGILQAFDANNVGVELWNNQMNVARDDAGNFAKFCPPTIANGRVYLGTFSNKVVVYGIIDSTAGAVCSNVNLALNKPAVASSSVNTTNTPAMAFDNKLTTQWESARGVDPQWIYVDLGQIDSICRVQLTWAASLAKDFRVAVSNDLKTWKVVANVTSNTQLKNIFELSTRGRYVAMFGTARGTANGYALFDFAVNGKVLPPCVAPGSLSYSKATPNSVVLKWESTGATSYTVQYSAGGSAQYKYINATADSVKITGLGCATNYTWQVRANCGGTPGSYSDKSIFTTTDCVDCPPLPTRVFNQDIGSVNIVGQACYTSQSGYNIKASGKDIGGKYDQFRYVFKTFGGDAIMQAKVTSQDQSSLNNKAGVMFRNGTDSGAVYIFLGITSGKGVNVAYRLTANTQASNSYVPGYKTPYFLRLVKSGGKFTGYISPDSVSWKQVFTGGNESMNTGPMNGGLAVSSGDNNKLSTAQFDQVGYYDEVGTLPNIALNRPALASSALASNKAAAGNDGNTATHWQSTTAVSPQYYGIDLGKKTKLSRVIIKWDNDQAGDYELRLSNDAQNWDNLVQKITANTTTNNSILLNTEARYVAVNALKSNTGKGYGIAEVQVYGDGAATLSGPLALSLTQSKPGSINIDQFVVSPNPTTGRLSINFVSTTDQDIQLVVTSISGKVIQTDALNNFKGAYHKAIDLSAWPPGYYVVSIKTVRGFIGRTVIKQ